MCSVKPNGQRGEGGITEKMTVEQRLEVGKEASHLDTRGKAFQAKGIAGAKPMGLEWAQSICGTTRRLTSAHRSFII